MKKTISLLFAGILAALLLAVCLLPQRTFSDMENRSLQQFPAPTLNGVRSREWMDQMESWLADQFPGRTFFVRTKASLDYLLGKRDLHDAYIGRDGRFFEVFDAQPDEAQLNKNIVYLQDFLSGTQRTAYFLPVYSAFTIYPEQLPAGAQEPDERSILTALNLPKSTILADPYDALLANRDDDLYFRTDHHWTQRGAYEAYLAFCRAAGFAPVTEYQQTQSPNPFYGSLFSQAPLWGTKPDEMSLYEIPVSVKVTYDGEKETSSLYEPDALNKKDQYTAFLDGNHALVRIESNAGTGKELILFKDSFAHALVPFLSQHYDVITMVDLRYYNRPLNQLLAEQPDAELLLTYNLSWMAKDTNLIKLKTAAVR